MTTALDLDELVLREPYRFDFFQAVRLLERMYRNRRPVGRHEDPADEVVHFHARNTLSFPASEIYDLTPPTEDPAPGPAHMWVNFMGLTGSQGALPRHYTGLLADPSAKTETAAFAAFLDLFNHRFISLFYRAWEKSRFPVAYERGDDDAFSRYLFSVVGLGTVGLRKRLSFKDEILLYYSGLLSQRPRSASALESLLSGYFDAPVQVRQFTGEWILMNPDVLTGLGTQNHQLGVSSVLWERVFDPQARFRVEIGPLPYAQFCEFLPSGQVYQELVEMTRFFAGDETGIEVRPLIRPDAVPALQLREEAPGGSPPQRLGWSMWFQPDRAPEQVVQPLFEARVAVPIGT